MIGYAVPRLQLMLPTPARLRLECSSRPDIAHGTALCAAEREFRCGTERGVTFGGRSVIAGPDGSVLAQAVADAPETIVADIDVAAADVKDIVVRPGAHEFHFWRDRRTELYGSITT